jgi:hypothetical protein
MEGPSVKNVAKASRSRNSIRLKAIIKVDNQAVTPGVILISVAHRPPISRLGNDLTFHQNGKRIIWRFFRIQTGRSDRKTESIFPSRPSKKISGFSSRSHADRPFNRTHHICVSKLPDTVNFSLMLHTFHVLLANKPTRFCHQHNWNTRHAKILNF